MNLDEQIHTEHLLMEERTCRVCGKEKSLLADFHRCGKDATIPSSYSYECKDCSRKRAVENYRKKKKYDLVREKIDSVVFVRLLNLVVDIINLLS